MPSCTQRASANTGRRTRTSNGHSSSSSGYEYDDTTRDTLYNTELNKVYAERDRYQLLFDQANKKLSETHQANGDMKTQLCTLKAEIAELNVAIQRYKDANDVLKRQNEALGQKHTALEARYRALASLSSAANSAASSNSVPHAPAAPSPALSCRKSSSSKKDKERHRDRDRDRDREDRSRRKDRDKDGEAREYKAERERLKERFEERKTLPSTTSSSSSHRRKSFIEQWGPGQGQPPLLAPAPSIPDGQMMPAVAVAVTAPYNNVAYSTVPRTMVPLTPALLKTSAAASSHTDDDGNYRPFPVGR
ncbi:hypothetical protein EsDP_00001174 [Epichloe bromicola]|uniref:Uncharacterized protein n=1 Tax=Epichloe bromicola TaxID=79588 RepID=A0ABQ0CH34_9HYPO